MLEGVESVRSHRQIRAQELIFGLPKRKILLISFKGKNSF